VCAYDGTEFRGWQSQVCGLALQDFIERRLKVILGKDTRTHASGRTDAGVHAAAQVFHFDANWPHGEEQMLRALRCGFPDTLQILSVKCAPQTFHARYGVKKKTYEYRIYEGFAPPTLTRFRWSMLHRKLDVPAMNEAAKILLGEHDFTSFSANHGKSDEDTVKTLYTLKVSRKGKEIKLSTTGSGYLYKMVRMITGALVDIGLGKMTDKDLKKILDAKKRGANFQAAPAKGLFLKKVYYK